MTTSYDAPIPYDSDIAYDGGPTVITPTILPTWQLDILNPLTGAASPLPEASIDQMSFEDSAVSAIGFTVPAGTVGANLCTDLAIVSLKANGVPVKDGRWLLRGAGWNEGSKAKVSSWTGRHLLWDRLEHAVIQPGPRKLFTGKSPGYILNDLFADAQLRDVGFFDTFTWTFTGAKDSNGQGWPSVLGSIEYLPTAKYSDIVANLVDKGLVEISLQGNEIRLTVPKTDGIVTPALLVVGKDVLDAPQQSSSDNLLSDIVVLGDDGVTVVRSNAETSAAYWREEGGISQGGTKDLGTLSIFGDVGLSNGARPRVQRTYGLVVTPDRPFLPLRNYVVGDWVRVQHAAGSALSVRVKQIVIKREKGYWSGTLVLNDKFLENELRLTKKVDGIIGGATITGSSQTSTPDDLKDNGIPKVPTGLNLAFDTYVDDLGRTQNTLLASWDPVTQNTDNSAATDLDNYYLEWRYSNEADSRKRVVVVPAGDNFVAVSPIEPGRSVIAWIYVGDQNLHFSGRSPGVAATSQADLTPPPQPSGPLGLSLLRVALMEWDGKTASGALMPADFHHLEVWGSNINDFDPTLEGKMYATMTAPGQVYIPMYNYAIGGTVYFKFVAVDNSGNRSIASTQKSQVIQGVQGPDITAGTITANNLGVGSVTAQAIFAGAITADKISLGGTQNLVPDPSFNNPDWRARRLTTNWTENPARWFFKQGILNRNGYYLQALSLPDGTNGGRMYLCEWIYPQLGESYYVGAYMRSGEFAPNAEATFRIGVEVTYADGTIDSDGISYLPTTTWTKYGYRFVIQNPLWVKVRFFIRADDMNAGDIAIDDLEIRGGVGTTEYSGSRGLLDPLGLFAWDGNDNNTFTLNFATGDFTAKGSIQSGYNGKRLQINPGSTYLPEIRFLPTNSDVYAYINAVDSGPGTVPFIGVNAPDTGVTGEAIILYDTGYQLGEVNKTTGTMAGPGMETVGTGLTGTTYPYGKLTTNSGAYGMMYANKYSAAALTTTLVITKVSTPPAGGGEWLPYYSLQRTTGLVFRHHMSANSTASYTVIFEAGAAGVITWVHELMIRGN